MNTCTGRSSSLAQEIVDLTSSSSWNEIAGKRKDFKVDIIEINDDNDERGAGIKKANFTDKGKIAMPAQNWTSNMKEAHFKVNIISSNSVCSKRNPTNYLQGGFFLQKADHVQKDYDDHIDDSYVKYCSSILRKPSNGDANSSNFVKNDEYSALGTHPDVIGLHAGIRNKDLKSHKSASPDSGLLLLENQVEHVKDKICKESLTLTDYEQFKQFDIVGNFSDHYYANQASCADSSYPGRLSKKKMEPGLPGGSLTTKTPRVWSKKIQNEWKLLENNLPDSIFVRVYEERIDLLRAAVLGAAGTPYHDGIFFFDACFPSSYPASPPLVHYHSWGLRVNPNLYNSGKVCLSLLNTWQGRKNEKWDPQNSTMLQVLLSIQALVLNAKPYFNEPGFAAMAKHPETEKQSDFYSENTFVLSCTTMMHALHRPPMHFESCVKTHFQQRAHAILDSCMAYMDGAQVGCLAGGGVQDVDEGDRSCSVNFRNSVSQMFPKLINCFSVSGIIVDQKYLEIDHHVRNVTSSFR